MCRGRPWRTFPWYLGQKNYSGLYWCATEAALVGYESRLELSHLMMADFDSRVKRIASQPFQLCAVVGGHRFKRIPDYLVCTEDVPRVIDVKTRRALLDPAVVSLLDRTRRVVESRGWRYEVVCEPSPVEFTNIRFLAGYRRPWLFDAEVLAAVRGSAQREGASSIGEIVGGAGYQKPLALAALLHLVWRREFVVDVSRRLSAKTQVSTAL
ncbi:hypothetical protein A5653_17685 [Mycobacterium colombiense]|nr:hypothetical protein A5653_17685 [Mycobacterium colombiense]